MVDVCWAARCNESQNERVGKKRSKTKKKNKESNGERQGDKYRGRESEHLISALQ